MSQQIQELINKIKAEGIQAADQKASEIETQARERAKNIVEDAKKEAEQLLAQAKTDVKKLKETTDVSLKQASRDMLLSLRKEIQDVLQRIMARQIEEALTPQKLGEILMELIKNFSSDKKSEEKIKVMLNAESLEALQQGFIDSLQKELKRPIVFESAQDLDKGFTISFDDGKSYFDFSDKSLAEHLGQYLNEYVAQIMEDAADG